MRILTKFHISLACLAVGVLIGIGCSNSNSKNLGNTVDLKTLDPFTQAMVAVKADDLEQLKTLVAANPDVVNRATESGMTLLHFAAIGSKTDVVKYLIDNGANLNARDKEDGVTPLEAAEREHADDSVIQMLRDAGGK